MDHGGKRLFEFDLQNNVANQIQTWASWKNRDLLVLITEWVTQVKEEIKQTNIFSHSKNPSKFAPTGIWTRELLHKKREFEPLCHTLLMCSIKVVLVIKVIYLLKFPVVAKLKKFEVDRVKKLGGKGGYPLEN